jgi:alpha-L-fucosidase 2
VARRKEHTVLNSARRNGIDGVTPTLWYNRPAATWLEALPIGNGRLGGMVWGGINEEVVADAPARRMQGPFNESYQPLGSVRVRVDGPAEPAEYRRSLDLSEGIAGRALPGRWHHG